MPTKEDNQMANAIKPDNTMLGERGMITITATISTPPSKRMHHAIPARIMLFSG
jgi:hypothetical protein